MDFGQVGGSSPRTSQPTTLRSLLVKVPAPTLRLQRHLPSHKPHRAQRSVRGELQPGLGPSRGF
jgi:hypothetical protein